jgi:GFO/IDH/MocA oxidoreductase family protein
MSEPKRVVIHFSRREFLQITACASLQFATPLLMPTDGMQQVRIAFVGVGSRGMALLKAATNIDCARVKAICDSDSVALRNSAALAAARKLDTPILFRQIGEILHQTQIDLFVLALPATPTLEVASALLRANKSVYICPPMYGLEGEWAVHLNLLRPHQNRVQIHLPHLFDSDARRIVSHARATRLGTLQRARIGIPQNTGSKVCRRTVDAIDFVLAAVNSSGPLDWHSVLVEPKTGPDGINASLRLTPDLVQTSELTIEITEQPTISDPQVILAGSGGRFLYEMPDDSSQLSQTFGSYLSLYMSKRCSLPEATLPKSASEPTLDRSLFANLLAALVSKATNTHRPFELQIA